MIFDLDLEEWVPESSGMEELPNVWTFDCSKCGNRWRQTYIEGQTDV